MIALGINQCCAYVCVLQVVGTIGPSCQSVDVQVAMLEAGMSAARWAGGGGQQFTTSVGAQALGFESKGAGHRVQKGAQWASKQSNLGLAMGVKSEGAGMSAAR